MWGKQIVIGDPNDPYLRRWMLFPKNRFFNIYLHNFVRSDDPRALHDHPYPNVSIVLTGGYLEHFTHGIRQRLPGAVVFRRAATPHRIELIRGSRPVWTLFFCGPRVREWGFHCPGGWRVWSEFVAPTPDGNKVGKGCD